MYRLTAWPINQRKNDAADAQTICEAVHRPHMRFVPVKNESQLAIPCLHCTRQGFIEEKTATYNRLQGLISEFSVIAPQSTDALRHMVSAQKGSLQLQVQRCVDDLLKHIVRIEANITEYDKILSHMTKTDHRSQRLTHSVAESARWSSEEYTGMLLWPSRPKTQGCAGHNCIMVIISGCTQPAKQQSCITI